MLHTLLYEYKRRSPDIVRYTLTNLPPIFELNKPTKSKIKGTQQVL